MYANCLLRSQGRRSAATAHVEQRPSGRQVQERYEVPRQPGVSVARLETRVWLGDIIVPSPSARQPTDLTQTS